MQDSYDFRALRMLLQPSIHLYQILNYYKEEDKQTILHYLATEKPEELLTFLNGLIENISEDIESRKGIVAKDNILDLESITVQLHIRLFISELRENYANIRDLLYHKDDSDVETILSIVNKELERNNIQVPEHILVGIRSKVLEGVKEAFTPSTKVNDEESNIVNKMELKNLKKIIRKK
ncbi:hypothetical protein [Sphingobacterium paludis]|uniref:Uncharacterized protein n=1 Tax=Sphingobacterium paludis TaxID=1476465 RepID=A0A4R7D1H2_9SPHI|nr:hypothetical protein [Sphingobacterium paludis]TDS14823.1 hypothetical protein B0I21_103323 [Sphingobacterium paludis]